MLGEAGKQDPRDHIQQLFARTFLYFLLRCKPYGLVKSEVVLLSNVSISLGECNTILSADT